jgi:radical SAM superfamily enzyme YgiQ (UPF0313 family)
MREILIVSGNVPKREVSANPRWVAFRNQGAHRIATVLREMGRDAEVIDNAQWFGAADIEALLATRLALGSLMLAFSVGFWFDRKALAALWADAARRLCPQIKIAVCGPKMSSAIDFLPGADLVISGYAEAALPDLMAHLDGRPGLRARALPGAGLAVCCQADYPQPHLPPLATRMQRRDFIEPGESLFLEASRGCVFRCAFCDFHLIGKRKGDYIRPREAILEQMMEHARWGVGSFVLSDETSNELDAKLEDLAWASEQMPKRPALSGFVRADLVAARPAQLDLMERAGLMRWHLGLETFNEASAKAIGKGAMAGRKVAQALERAKERFGDELSVGASLIVGLPHDTTSDLGEMADWLRQSEVVSHATFFRLWLFDKAKDDLGLLATDGLSMLAGDPGRYGYERMGADIPARYAGRIDPSEFLWRSKAGMDIFHAADLADELNTKIQSGPRQWRDMSMWGRAAAAGLGFDALRDHRGVVNRRDIERMHDMRARRYVKAKIHWSDLSASTAVD